MHSATSIIVCADDPLGRAGLAALLGSFSELTIVAQEDSSMLAAGGAVEGDGRAEAIVWDLGWNEARDDLDLTTLDVPVVALVLDEEQAGDAWRAGCRGLLWRNTPEEELLAAVQAVGAGFVVLSPSLFDLINRPFPQATDQVVEELTHRETEVLELVAQGLTNKAIGQRLGISEHTVKFHLNAILAKLSAQSRTEAVVIATRQGLISL